MSPKSNQLQTLVLMAVSATAGCAAGFFFGADAPPMPPSVSQSAPGETRVEILDSQKTAQAPSASATEIAARLLSATTATDAYKRRHDIYEIVALLDGDGIRRALDDSEKFGAYARDLVRPQLLSRWVEYDANAAFEWADKLPLKQRDYMMREFFDSLALKNPAQLVAHLQREKESPNSSGESLAMSAFSAWASRAPSDAVDAALKIDKLYGRNALYGAFQRWSQMRPQDAFLRLQTLPETERSSVSGLVFSAWAERDKTAAMEAAQSLTDVRFRTEAIGKIIAKIGEINRDDGARMLDALPRDERLRVLEVVASAGHWDNPRFGVMVLSRLPASRERSSVNQLAYQLGRLNPQEAIQWAEGLRSEEARKSARGSVVQQWAQVDPKAAFDYELQNPSTDSPYSNSAFNNWVGKDPDAAWEWMKKMPDSQSKEFAVGTVIAAIARKDPERALREVAILPVEKRGQAMGGIARAWAAKDHASALKWAVALPENERYQTVGAAVDTLARTDSGAAIQWLQEQPDVKLRDFATNGFASALIETDPDTAIKWAMTISEPGSRESTLKSLVARWHRDDATSFAAWRSKGNVLPESVLPQSKPKR